MLSHKFPSWAPQIVGRTRFNILIGLHWEFNQGQPTLVQNSYSQIQTRCNGNFVSFDIFQKTAVVN
jgi:hypothetical protein